MRRRITLQRARTICAQHPETKSLGTPWCPTCNTFAPCETRQLALGWIASRQPRTVADKEAMTR